MLDQVESPSFKILKCDKNSRVSVLLQGESNRTLCFHNEKLYCKIDESNQAYLIFLGSNSDIWEPVEQIPFGYREGQSMTSTNSGMAFFGGANSTTFYNDLWIHMNTTEWFTVPTYIPARKNHAATCDSQGHLIIYGGTGPNGALNDLYMVDITTQEVKQIQLIDNSPLPRLVNHSMTLLKDSTFFLFGKNENNSNSGSKEFTYIAHQLDIEKCTLTPIHIEYENAIESARYYTSYIYKMVFLFGLTQNQPIWMYDLITNTWIPFSVPTFKGQSYRPLYLFISESFSQKKSIHIIDYTLSRLISIPVFTTSPPEDVRESPQFIHFLKSHLKYGCTHFDDLKVHCHLESEKIIDKIKTKFDDDSFVNSYFSLSDNCDLSEELRKKAEKIHAMMNLSENQFNINLSNLLSDNNISSSEALLNKELNVYEIISTTNEIRKKGKEEIAKLSEQAEILSQQIEQTYFQNLSNNTNQQQNQPQLRENSPGYIRLLQRSKQLANEIQFERARLDEVQQKIKSLGFTKKNKILNIRYQIWSVTQSEYQKTMKLQEIKTNFFNAVADIYSLRHQELLINDPNVRSLAEDYVKKPDLISQMKDAQENLKNIITSFSEQVDDLGLDDKLRQEGSYHNKLLAISNNLDMMLNWVDEANSLLTGQPLPSNTEQPPVSTSSRSRSRTTKRSRNSRNLPPPPGSEPPIKAGKVTFAHSRVNNYFTRFSHCMGDSDIYLSDLQSILSKIEKGVDIFSF